MKLQLQLTRNQKLAYTLIAILFIFLITRVTTPLPKPVARQVVLLGDSITEVCTAKNVYSSNVYFQL